jgi:NACalpha-BTF3-like transcription factor
MKITLEMVDQVIDRTGANYQEAKEALIKCDGDVLEAIVLLDSREKVDEEHVIIKKIKELIEKGKISRILIEKDEVNILNIPVFAGIIGGIVFINATIVGLITAIVLGYDIYVINDSNQKINIKEYTKEKCENVVNKVVNKKTEENESSDDDDDDEEEDNN